MSTTDHAARHAHRWPKPKRGQGDARALRSVADRPLGLACAMLKTGSSFDPNPTAKTA